MCYNKNETTQHDKRTPPCSSPSSPITPTSSQTSRSTAYSQGSESSDAPTTRCVSQAATTLAIANDGRGIIDRNAATWAFEQNIHSARFRHKASTFGHYVTIALTVTVTDENGDMQEHDICAFDHYGKATTVNVDETANGN